MSIRYLFLVVAILLSACETHQVATEITAANPSTARGGLAGHGVTEADRAQFIQEHDLNQDKRVTLEEFERFRRQRFQLADEGSKSYLSLPNYVDEYATRLDLQLEQERRGQLEQTQTRFRALDKDSDGFISRAEYGSSGERMFSGLDKQGLGVITKGEVNQVLPSRRRSVLAMPTSHSVDGFIELYDADGDNRVTRTEFDGQRSESFIATDTNGDGKLAFDEYRDEFLTRVDRQAESVRQRQLQQAEVRFGVIDTNKDGRIDWDEYWATGKRTFERWDTQGKGTVTTDSPLPEPRRSRTVTTNSHSPRT